MKSTRFAHDKRWYVYLQTHSKKEDWRKIIQKTPNVRIFGVVISFLVNIVWYTTCVPTSNQTAERLRNAAVARTATGTHTYAHVRGGQTTTRRRRLRLRWQRQLEKNLSTQSLGTTGVRALVVDITCVRTYNNNIITIILYKRNFDKTKHTPS